MYVFKSKWIITRTGNDINTHWRHMTDEQRSNNNDRPCRKTSALLCNPHFVLQAEPDKALEHIRVSARLVPLYMTMIVLGNLAWSLNFKPF